MRIPSIISLQSRSYSADDQRGSSRYFEEPALATHMSMLIKVRKQGKEESTNRIRHQKTNLSSSPTTTMYSTPLKEPSASRTTTSSGRRGRMGRSSDEDSHHSSLLQQIAASTTGEASSSFLVSEMIQEVITVTAATELANPADRHRDDDQVESNGTMATKTRRTVTDLLDILDDVIAIIDDVEDENNTQCSAAPSTS